MVAGVAMVDKAQPAVFPPQGAAVLAVQREAAEAMGPPAKRGQAMAVAVGALPAALQAEPVPRQALAAQAGMAAGGETTER
ncbi:hypothetical protein AWJ14_11635 [Hoeflea olei]|uniref:Uncharacterized protein n=1 Tax=Hoeflea olei TaxID=1480615 RepID=A0A1C1YQU9_9HYPH|nr:hypothetical protein AWJ14_11635 [Hoeflea olei]